MAAAKVLRELGGKRSRSLNLEWLRRTPLGSFNRPWDYCSSLDRGPSKYVEGADSSHQVLFPTVAGAGASALHRLLGGNPLLVGQRGTGVTSTAVWESARLRSFVTASRIAPSQTPASSQSSGTDPERPTEQKKTENKSLGSRIGTLLSDLDEVPLGALGLGLAGAIPFVGLTPGIASLLPLPEALSSIHVEAQAAYGAVILTFLGGPHWGLAMTDYGRPSTSKVSRKTVQTLQYVWSVTPSLLAWAALLLNPVPKLALLITSFGLALGVDAIFARMGLIPSWYMPLRILLTGIAMLSMTSSMIVTAAANVVTH